MKALPLLLFALALSACSSVPVKEKSSAVPVAKASVHTASCMAYDGKPVPKSFKDFDRDANGEISREEFLCQVVKYFNVNNRNHDGYLTGKELNSLRRAKNRADVNGDKKVSVVEFMETAEGAFDAFDADKSSTLSETEFNAGVAAVTKK